MRKSEREAVRQSIRELMQDDPPFEVAVGRLCRLVGWRYPASEVNVGSRTIREIASGPERPFMVRVATEHAGGVRCECSRSRLSR